MVSEKPSVRVWTYPSGCDCGLRIGWKDGGRATFLRVTVDSLREGTYSQRRIRLWRMLEYLVVDGTELGEQRWSRLRGTRWAERLLGCVRKATT